jgi:glycosyltransferase involved in cell wall biosynthesis
MSCVNIMIASLALGGAERIVHETISSLQPRATRGTLFVLKDVGLQYSVNTAGLFEIHRWKARYPEDKLRETADRVLRSGTNLLFTHLIAAKDLRVLWDAGVQTVPVIHNAKDGWQDPAESYPAANAPFAVAVSDSVASELRESGCQVPVVTIRHELQRWFRQGDVRRSRLEVRRRHGIADDTFLIGMVGCFKAQKAYPRAIRALAELRKVRNAKLMIVGSWDHDYGYGRLTFEVVCRLIEELDLQQDVFLVGAVDDVDPYYSAFDVYLNTSVYEGLSIALLEAQQWGCPVVTANAGGNAEALLDGSVLIQDSSDIAAYVDALSKLQQTERTVAEKPAYPDLVPRIWVSLGDHGVDKPSPRSGVLFVTNNLNMGGAQRSLTNLLVNMPDKESISACVLGAIHSPFYLEELDRASVRVITFEKPAHVVDTAERVLNVVDSLNVRTVCFWNVDACVKLLVSKILSCTSVRIIDVSPGTLLFRELDETVAFQRRISYTAADYVARLDSFVCKSNAGTTNPLLNGWKNKVVVIPNGVPAASRLAQTADRSADSVMHVGTCGRVAPENRIEFLLDSFAIVAKRLGGASLTIVGEAQNGHRKYKDSLLSRTANLGLKNVHFAGAVHDVTPHLRSFRVFLSAFDEEGCSNAVLEAMAAGTPVVATASPSSRELIQSGVDGFVVSNTDPRDMADKIEILLTRPDVADSFGRASESTVRQRFSMNQMVDQYRSLLAC